MSDGLHQALMPLDVVGEAELRRRDAELRGGAAVAQVAGKRDLDAAAQAIAIDHRHGRLGRALDRMQHAVEQIVVLGHRTALGPVFLEFGDVGAGGKGLGAGAAKCDATHLGISVEARHRLRKSSSRRLKSAGSSRLMAWPLFWNTARPAFGMQRFISKETSSDGSSSSPDMMSVGTVICFISSTRS